MRLPSAPKCAGMCHVRRAYQMRKTNPISGNRSQLSAGPKVARSALARLRDDVPACAVSREGAERRQSLRDGSYVPCGGGNDVRCCAVRETTHVAEMTE